MNYQEQPMQYTEIRKTLEDGIIRIVNNPEIVEILLQSHRIPIGYGNAIPAEVCGRLFMKYFR